MQLITHCPALTSALRISPEPLPLSSLSCISSASLVHSLDIAGEGFDFLFEFGLAGLRGSKIAAHSLGRTDNEIKSYWRTRVQKQARQLNMESNSQSLNDAIRCFYMPRLVRKIERSSTSCATLNSEASSPSSPSKFPEFPTGCTKNNTYCSNNTLSNMPEIPHQQTSVLWGSKFVGPLPV
ncbi:hypothetical protein Cgig2_018867 [Carnegiea gigantea]|uniref:HTH myb-type domain-containing protein n=1 Tax=Carnegiea gigantea TaxID=171969 RepID=A0A9Q1K7W4_9CARY|nr:hypothetical protein Cgig2_018867 [Carnegiea gigantea]